MASAKRIDAHPHVEKAPECIITLSGGLKIILK